MYFKFILKRVYGIAAMKGALGASMWRDDSNAAEKVKKTPFLNKRTFHNWYAQVFVAFIAFQNRSLSKCILMQTMFFNSHGYFKARFWARQFFLGASKDLKRVFH